MIPFSGAVHQRVEWSSVETRHRRDIMDVWFNRNHSSTPGDSHNLYVQGIDSVQAAQPVNQTCRLFDFFISVVLVGVSCLLGFMGNLLSIIVLRRDPRTSVTLFLLTVLAVVDFLFLIPMTLLFVVPGVCRFLWNCPLVVRNTLPYIDRYTWAVASMTHTATVYVTLLVTIHRYISVCRPHEAAKLSTLRTAKRQVILVSVFAVVFNIPRFLEFNVETAELGESTRTWTPIGENPWYQVVYKNICFYLLMYIIPLTTLIILSAKLTRTLKARRRYRYRVSLRRHVKEDNTTFVLIIIVAIFIVCQTPTPFQRLFYTIFGKDGRKCGHFFFYFEKFADYLAVLNSCVNFMIYVIFAPGFRQTLRTMFCGRRC